MLPGSSDEEEEFEEDGIGLKAVYNDDLDEMSDEGDYEGEEGEEDEDDGVIEEEEEADGEADEEEDGEAGKVFEKTMRIISIATHIISSRSSYSSG